MTATMSKAEAKAKLRQEEEALLADRERVRRRARSIAELRRLLAELDGTVPQLTERRLHDGSLPTRVLSYLRSVKKAKSLDDLMERCGCQSRNTLAVTMVKLKKAGLVEGGEREGGFKAV